MNIQSLFKCSDYSELFGGICVSRPQALNLYAPAQALNLFFSAPSLNLCLSVLRFLVNKFVIVTLSTYINSVSTFMYLLFKHNVG